MNETVRPLPSLSQQRPQVDESGSAVAAAFRLENDVVNIWQMARRGQMPLDPEFNINEAAEGSDLWQDHMDLLAPAQSRAEFDSISNRIRQEQIDRARLQGMGLSGALLAMGAGVASPTMFIPLTGQARGAAGVRQAFALATGAATAQEVPLLMNQQTRTALESGINIAAGTVLGGLLGTAAVYLRQSDRALLARGIEPDAPPAPKGAIIKHEDGSYERIGSNIQLNMPAGIYKSPKDFNSASQIQASYGAVQRAAQVDDWVGVRRLADDPKTPLPVREAAQEMLELTTPVAMRIARAEAAGVSQDIAEVWARGADEVLRAPTPEARQAARQQLSEGLEALGVHPEQQPALLARLEALEDAGPPDPVRLAQTLSEERIAPHIMQAEEVAGIPGQGRAAGAQRTGARETPYLPVKNDVTGEIEYIPLLDPSITPDPGTLAGDVGGVLTQLARVNPVVRVIQQPGMPIKSQLARHSMMQLSDGGLQYTGGRYGIAPAPGGTVEDRIGYYFARMAAAFTFQSQAYMRYLGRADTFANRRLTDFQSTFNIAPGAGKLSFKEFKEQVMDSFHNGYQSPIPEANEVARNWTSEYFGKFNEAMLEATDGRGAKALYEVLDDADPMRNYISHIYSVDKIVEDREGFIRLVADHLQTSMSAIAMRKWQKMRQREGDNLELEDILRMDAEQARMEFDRIDDALRALPRDQDFSPEMQRVRELRDQRRQLVDDEFERLMDKSAVYRRGDPDSERGAQAKARENMREEYKALSDEIAAAEARVPKSDLDIVDKRKSLKRRKRALTKSFGALKARQEEALQRIGRNEAQNLAALQRFQDQSAKLLARLERLDDAAIGKEIEKLDAQFEKILRQIDKGEERIAKLTPDREGEHLVDIDYTPTERISIESAKQDMRRERLQNLWGRRVETASGPINAREALREKLEAVKQYTNRVNSARSERNARLRDTIKRNDPDQVRSRIGELQAANAARRADFERWLEDAGAGGDLDAGRFDFSEAAEEYAGRLSYKITGEPSRIAQLDTMPELKGMMKRRVLDIPYEQKKRYLEMDSERVLGIYTRSMGADIELFRAFGSVNGGNMIANVQSELKAIEKQLRTRTVDDAGKTITDARRKKDLKAHAKGASDIIESLDHAITRLRGLAGMPNNPEGLAYRMGRAARFLNVMTMMGSAAVTSIPDIGRTVMMHGMTRTFRDSWMPFIGGLVRESDREITKAVYDQLKLFNIGVEFQTQQRAQAGFSIEMDTPGRTRLERLIELGAVKTPTIALFGIQTDIARQLAGSATLARFVTNIDNFAAGRMRPGDPELHYMVKTGLDPQIMDRIARELNKPDGHTVVNGVKVPNTAAWDYQAMRAFGAAMQRESNNIVIQPGLERMNWADQHPIGSIIFQFRSFTMGAHSKMLLSGLQQRDMAAFHALQGVTMSLALGALSYYIWARSTSDRATEEMQNASWETWLDQAIYRSGLTGLFAEVQSIGSKIPATADLVTFEGSSIAGRRPNSIMGAIAGPTYGTAETIASVLAGMDEPTQGTLSQARKLIPYQNVFYLRRALNIVEEGLGEALNIPESRR